MPRRRWPRKPGSGDVRLDFEFGVGIAMILLSFVFAYGAELEEKKDAAKEQKLPQA